MVETVTARCSANRGRRIPRDTVLRLVAASAGHCASPFCGTGFLWHELSNGSAVRLGEVAHIVAASVGGPRGDAEAPESDLVAYENLVLLCPTCHQVVDGAPEEYPVETLRQWKVNHEARISELLGVGRHETREGAHAQLLGLLEENRVVWETYGPESADGWRPEVADIWLREVRDVILPNNARIGKLLEVNSHLLSPTERAIVAEFAAHARAIEHRHLAGVINPAAPLFPARLNSVYLS
jgi:hypothetical protein